MEGLGPFPEPVWATLVGGLVPRGPQMEFYGALPPAPDAIETLPQPPPATRQTLLALRATSRALARVVERCGQGGLAVVRLAPMADRAVRAPWSTRHFACLPEETLRLGRLIVADVKPGPGAWSIARLREALRRRHLVRVFVKCTSRFAEDPVWQEALLRLDRAGLLREALVVRMFAGERPAVAFMTRVRTLTLCGGAAVDVEGLAGARNVALRMCRTVPLDPLANLERVDLVLCGGVSDIFPLANVPELRVEGCQSVIEVGAMRNRALEVAHCPVTTIAGLAQGRVLHLSLAFLYDLTDLTPIGSMRSPPAMVRCHRIPRATEFERLKRLPHFVMDGVDFSTTGK